MTARFSPTGMSDACHGREEVRGRRTPRPASWDRSCSITPVGVGIGACSRICGLLWDAYHEVREEVKESSVTRYVYFFFKGSIETTEVKAWVYF